MTQPKTLLIPVLLIFSVQHALSQSVGKRSLSGLEGVNVSISVSDEAQEEDLFENDLKSNTELQLRKAEIDVYEDDELAAHPAAPVLEITVGTYRRRGVFSYIVSTGVSQVVYTVDGTGTSGTTYEVDKSIGVVGADKIRDLTDVVRQHVRTFINDWLSVHE
jgi:hypothetical protein